MNVAIAAVELHDLIDIAMEWKLIAGGLVLLAVAGFIAHRLRDRTQGIVTTDEEIKALDAALPIAIAVTAMPAGAGMRARDDLRCAAARRSPSRARPRRR